MHYSVKSINLSRTNFEKNKTLLGRLSEKPDSSEQHNHWHRYQYLGMAEAQYCIRSVTHI